MPPPLWMPRAVRYHSGSTQSNDFRVAASPHTGVAALRLEPPTVPEASRGHIRNILLDIDLFVYTWNREAWHMGCNGGDSTFVDSGRGNGAEAENSGPADGSGRGRAALRQTRPAASAPGRS